MRASVWSDRLRRMALLACLAGVAALAACGGGGGGADSDTAVVEPPLAGDFFPLHLDDLWIYDDAQGARATVRAEATATVDGQQGMRIVTETPDGLRVVATYLVTSSAVRMVPVSGDALVQAIGPVDLMRLPMHVGDRFVQIDRRLATAMDFDADGRADPVDVRSDVEVIGQERVTTPAGAFDGAVHLRTTLRATVQLSSSGQRVNVDSIADDWYAPGVGPVRTTITTTDPVGGSETVRMAVAAWRVGSRRSESTPPSPVAFDPAGDVTQGRPASLNVRFDEPLDVDSAAGGLTLQDALGQPVAGSVELAADRLTFWPAVPLSSGVYTGRIAPTVADLLGNRLGSERTWRFTVDATGPQVVAVAPALDAADVARDAAITVRYDETLAPDSLGAGNVALRALIGGEVPVDVAVHGDTVTVTPRSLMERGLEYMLVVGTGGYGPRDRYGNFAIGGTVARFTTDPGRFGAQQALPTQGAAAAAVASGDVNGDGRSDVVIAVGDDPDPARAWHLGVLRQQPDGVLGPVAWIPSRASYGCRPTSVAIGDVNGDGRRDVVLAEFGCGVEVFLQDAAGVLQPGPFLPSAQSYAVRVADLDGDGRQDLAATGWNEAVARLWRQTSAGELEDMATPALQTHGWGQMAVGDLDGDGRADVAVTSGQGDRNQALGVLLRRGDGSFAPPVYVAGTRFGALFPGVAIGDIDGDGRAELLAAIDDNRIGVWRVDGGVLVRVRDIAVAEGAAQIVLADVNGDNRQDLLVLRVSGGFPGLTVRLQQSDGTLGTDAHYAGFGGSGLGEILAVGDVSGDGRPDVLLGASVLVQRPVGQFAQGRPQRSISHWLRRAAERALSR